MGGDEDIGSPSRIERPIIRKLAQISSNSPGVGSGGPLKRPTPSPAKSPRKEEPTTEKAENNLEERCDELISRTPKLVPRTKTVKRKGCSIA